LRLSEALQQTGHPEQAHKVLSQAYQQAPNHVELAYAYAKTLMETGQYAEALAPLQMIVNARPDSPEAYTAAALDLGRALLALGRPGSAPQAVAALQRALQITPNHPHALALLAEALAADGQFEAALSTFRFALDTDLTHDASWSARLSFGLGKLPWQQVIFKPRSLPWKKPQPQPLAPCKQTLL
jgi:Flp pilus assembly protein TadD